MMLSYATLLLGAVSLGYAFDSKKSCSVITQQLSDPPYENYFYSDCHVDTQIVITSPLPDSNLTIIGPRLIAAWPAGNSGICTFFQPQSGKNGTLGIELVNSTLGQPLRGIYNNEGSSDVPNVGVEGVISFNTSTNLATAILGSIRNIRDFTEGPSILEPIIQDAINVTKFNKSGVQFSRLWLDNVTTTTFTLIPWENPDNEIEINNGTASFGAGFYHFSASLDYPQLKQLNPEQVLNSDAQTLIKEKPSQTGSLSFFSYTEKLLAGGWRYLTYFGRDSMISALLLEPVLSTGSASAMEAVIGAVLERINRTDGSVCHEETIGDYATFLNLKKNISSTTAGFTYPMIDTDYFLPVLMARYFDASPTRIRPLLSAKAGSIDSENKNLTWGDLSYIGAQKIMNMTKAFADNSTVENLMHLKESEIVGQWRDSTYGLANGRIPFDVNCALVPAALYAISELAKMPGVYPNDSMSRDWATVAAKRAKIWEDKTLTFFQYNVTIDEAKSRLQEYIDKSTFYDGPTHAEALTNYSSSGKVINYAIAINSSESPEKLPIMHTDTAFRLFLLNSTNDNQLTTFINATANAIIRPFPAGLTTPVGAVVANPALSGEDVLIANFTNSAYHGTVVWSWQLALMAKGLERQLERCTESNNSAPAFCGDKGVYGAVKKAYNILWDAIDDNSSLLQSEVWGWTYSKNVGYKMAPLGALPPPQGVSGGTESNVRQLWSLTFLSVTRNVDYK
ncbi:unnamed protein product [Clonostachys rhizophaga]|uniref:Glycogen debranching enzyme n=1 Tax=Clonostachys rhizophaga TaxID=160324 RepID=A0A9N9VEI5_9HYPO|nr:unnamed protein product [Clonostachys rhizophaga]